MIAYSEVNRTQGTYATQSETENSNTPMKPFRVPNRRERRKIEAQERRQNNATRKRRSKEYRTD